MSRTALVAAAAAALLAGCMEVEQASNPGVKQAGQTVKRDTKPWDNTPLAKDQGPQWTKGDKTTWETQLKNRQLSQHEHKRIYQ